MREKPAGTGRADINAFDFNRSGATRRVPTQDRARARVERMLEAAESLIVANGIGNLKINEVAAKAGVPIGSVYEYFAGREDILAALAERHFRVIEAETTKTFAEVTSISGLLAEVEGAVARAWRYVRENPGFRELLCGVQAFEGLRDLDWADSMANANTILAAAAPLLPNVERKEILALCLIICDAAGATARLSLHFKEHEASLQKAFADMVRNQFVDLVRRNAAERPEF